MVSGFFGLSEDGVGIWGYDPFGDGCRITHLDMGLSFFVGSESIMPLSDL